MQIVYLRDPSMTVLRRLAAASNRNKFAMDHRSEQGWSTDHGAATTLESGSSS